MNGRSILNAALLVFLIAGSFRPFLLRLVLPPHRMPDVAGPENGIDRRPLRLWNDATTPQDLLHFLQASHDLVPRGRSVSVVFSPPYDGFSFQYWRAAYELAGRDVIPPVYNPSIAEYIAVWHSDFSDPAFEPMWSGFGGTVWKRR